MAIDKEHGLLSESLANIIPDIREKVSKIRRYRTNQQTLNNSSRTLVYVKSKCSGTFSFFMLMSLYRLIL